MNFLFQHINKFGNHLFTPSNQAKSILIAFLCCNLYNIFLLLQISVVLRIYLISVSILRCCIKLFKVFDSTLKLHCGLLRNSEFIGLEVRSWMTKTLQRNHSQSLLKAATSDVLGHRNSWTSEKSTYCTHYKRPHQRRVQMRLKWFWGQKCVLFLGGNVWFITMLVYLLCPHVPNSKNQRRRCFQKGLKRFAIC